jgi:hypothetical protein
MISFLILVGVILLFPFFVAISYLIKQFTSIKIAERGVN